MRTKRGMITDLYRLLQHETIRQGGTIRGEDGGFYEFWRENMVTHSDYLDLRTGDRVIFEVGTPGRAINVKRTAYLEPT